MVLRSVHVGFLLALAYFLFRFRKRDQGSKAPWYDIAFAVIAFGLSFYHWVYEGDLIQRAGDPSTTDLVVGTIITLLVLEAARRIMGWELPLLCALFIPYAIFGRDLPGFLVHRGFDYTQEIGSASCRERVCQYV